MPLALTEHETLRQRFERLGKPSEEASVLI